MKAWKFRYLLNRAQNDRQKPFEELIEYVNKASKSTNRKMRALEKSGYTYYDYDPAKSALDYMGRKRFRETWNIENAKENWEDFVNTAKAVYRFDELGKHTTPTKMAQYSAARLDYVLKKLNEINGTDYDYLLKPSNERGKQKRQFLERAISGGSLGSLISAGYGNTGETLEALESAFENNASVDAINQKLEPYLAQLQQEGRTTTIEDIWRMIK